MKAINPKAARIIAIVMPAVALVFAGIFLGAWLFNSNEQPTAVAAQGGRGTVAVPENIDTLLEDIKVPVEDAYYEATMNVDWQFPNGSSPSNNAYVENATSNTRTVYFDVLLKDTEELVYSSPYIPVGSKLEKFSLDYDLSAGEYDATVVYHLVDDEQNEISTVKVTIKLYVLE
jgi:hypothetical protein